jgi:hypothetical protein
MSRARAGADWPAQLSSPSWSQEGGNEPSCRALSAELDTVRPIPPREAGGLLEGKEPTVLREEVVIACVEEGGVS